MKNDIYVLAHEIKNPLCVVSGYLEIMNNTNFLRYKEIIKEEINTSIELLNNYLEYNKLVLNKEEMDINVLFSDIKKSMKDYLKRKGIHLRINSINDEIYLKADYDKLKEVFYNIIKNSIESQSLNIFINCEVFYNDLIITIKNDGEKICNDNISKIGHDFSNKVLGNGIGTTLAKKIIKLHDGEIKYQNNQNKGIKTTITLPLS